MTDQVKKPEPTKQPTVSQMLAKYAPAKDWRDDESAEAERMARYVSQTMGQSCP
jgi:hypothetical protein